MFLIPLRHENMEGRRWPVITFTLIALNLIAFLVTHWTIEEQQPELAETRIHILLLAAMHPELKTPDDVQQFVNDFQTDHPEGWKLAGSPNRRVEDGWDARIRLVEDPETLQSEMDSLSQRFQEVQAKSIVQNYAFIPAHKRAISYLTANFLHGGWLHLIGNMWFLWLAGFILEDNWGRIIYPVFYLIAGVAALQFHAWSYPHSLIPVLGASGAVAALMGAFLVRFPTLKIHMWGIALFFRFRFKASAYWLLPLWLLTEIFYGALFGQASGVAHWAHVGGFLFGALAAVVIQHTGLEHKANTVIESKIGWSADPAVVQASESLGQGKLDEAIDTLQKHIANKPDSVDALTLLQQALWRKNDLTAYREATIKLCQLHLKAQDSEAAWHSYEEFVQSGGEKIPAAEWLELCRCLENNRNFDRAVSEYEKLAEAYSTERQSLLALMSAGRLSLKQMNRPSDALRFYRAASSSPVPHLDWESNIRAGIEDAEKLLTGSYSSSTKS